MQADKILVALGGQGNIISVERAITRLRFAVHATAKVDERALRELGACAVVIQRHAVQLICGPFAVDLANDIAQIAPEIAQM